MPDFDTRKPQEPNEPNRFRTLLAANWPRTGSISVVGIFFFVMVVIAGGLLIYQYVGPESVICNKEYLSQAGACIAPRHGYASVVCEAESRALVEKQEYCRKGSNDPYPYV